MTADSADIATPATSTERPRRMSDPVASDGVAVGKRRAPRPGQERMALKKSDLYSSLWKGADELRGGMDASQYKDYVLTLLFVKYISDRSERTLLEIPEGASWRDITALRNDKEIGDKINKIIARLAEANELQGVIDLADFNDENKLGRGREMVDRLSKLVGIFDDLDFGSNSADGDDLLGDAYEYLMRHFATESGKSKGQFYTPAEVSMILARVVGIGADTTPDQTVYDPTCGSGALLLKAAHEAPRGMSVYGQEMDNATYALARMNMILHGYETAELWHGNTLSSPHFKSADGSLRTFDFAVANPPFSVKAWTSGLDPQNDPFHRFDGFGVPPEKNGDYAFLLHILKSLKSTGKAAVILPHGVLFRGNREAGIRSELVKRRLIKGIIGLPSNLFYGTGIAACVIVLDKAGAAERDGVFMIDASRGFLKDGNKNRLRARDLHRIVDVFTEGDNVDGYARLVPFAEIESPANDCNLNISRYIDSRDAPDIQDVAAHLGGGIPRRDVDALQAYWDALPGMRDVLFEDTRPGYCQLHVGLDEIDEEVAANEAFRRFIDTIIGRFGAWQQAQIPQLKSISIGDHANVLLSDFSEDILAALSDLPLIDPYAIYQHLMDYWDAEMQDDVYEIITRGWLPAAREAGADLVPRSLIAARYFAAERARLDEIAATADAAAEAVDAFEERHGGEDGGLSEARADSGKLTKGSVTSRIREIAVSPAFADESLVLSEYLTLLNAQARAKKALKDGEAALEARVDELYERLTEDELKTLVVEDKWLAHLAEVVHLELAAVCGTLTGRVAELGVRYSATLPELVAESEIISTRVAAHFVEMGVIA